MTILRLFFIVIIFFSCRSYKNDNSFYSRQYVIDILWKEDFHGLRNASWLLEESSKTIFDENFMLMINNRSYNVTSIISPRFPKELLVCCETGDLEEIWNEIKRPSDDSTNSKYKDAYYNLYDVKNDFLILDRKKAFFIKKDTLKTNFQIRFFKVQAVFCMCKPAINNLGAEFEDSIANIKKVIKYFEFQSQEKSLIKKDIYKLFKNKIIISRLPINSN